MSALDTGATTTFGFEWGPMEVSRACLIEGARGSETRVIDVKTPRDEVEIYVTRTGKIRVFRRGAGEMKVDS